MDNKTYVDDVELTKYVWNHYSHFRSRFEDLGWKAAAAISRADNASGRAMAELLRKEWGSQTAPDIVAALDEGAEVFRRRVRDRVLRENGDKVFINRCLACRRIVCTPRARQCLWCGHSWHDGVLKARAALNAPFNPKT